MRKMSDFAGDYNLLFQQRTALLTSVNTFNFLLLEAVKMLQMESY